MLKFSSCSCAAREESRQERENGRREERGGRRKKKEEKGGRERVAVSTSGACARVARGHATVWMLAADRTAADRQGAVV
jgi:hypothetical protein